MLKVIAAQDKMFIRASIFLGAPWLVYTRYSSILKDKLKVTLSLSFHTHCGFHSAVIYILSGAERKPAIISYGLALTVTC